MPRMYTYESSCPACKPATPPPAACREVADVLWAHGRLRHTPCRAFTRAVLQPLSEQPDLLRSARSADLSRLAAGLARVGYQVGGGLACEHAAWTCPTWLPAGHAVATRQGGAWHKE